MNRYINTALITVFLTACVPSDDSATTESITPQNLQHHRWLLTQIDGVPLPRLSQETAPVALEIGEGMTVNGNAGCNNFGGQGELMGEQFKAGPLRMTMMICPEQAMAIEEKVSSTLSEWSTITLTPSTLTLTGSAHQLTFQLSDWK